MDNANIATLPAPGAGFTTRFSPRTRALFLLGAAGLVALVSAAWLWSSSPNFGVLFTNVADRDGGAILAQLSQMNVPYKTSEGGTILVPAEKVPEVRLKLASQGLPKGSIVGYELMENAKIGMTQFQEQINYQRALEGELVRSIQTLGPVEAARVHLALPKASGFLRDKEPPTASVVLQLRPGLALDRAQVAGIVHLVASSVPELNPKNVSVVDQHGTLLASRQDGVTGLNPSQLDYVAQVEQSTIQRIEDILTPVVGRGNVRAQATADIDFTDVEQVDEKYAPNESTDKSTVRSRVTVESSQPGSTTAQGVPGALSNQPPPPATAPISGNAPPLNPPAAAGGAGASTHKEQTTNYEVDKTIHRSHAPTGQIRRITAAVVINNKPGEGGQGPGTPWDPKELENLQTLARDAMGFSEQRGDTINVINAPFTLPEIAAAEPVPLLQKPGVLPLAQEGGKALLFLVLTAILVFGVFKPAMKSFSQSAAAADAAAVPAIAAAPEAAPAPAPGGTMPAIENVRQIAKSDPAAVANVVKVWVADGR